MSGRSKVLGDIRRALGRDKLDQNTVSRLEARMNAPPRSVRDHFDQPALERFIQKLESPVLNASAECVEGFSAVPMAVAWWLAQHEIDHTITPAPGLSHLDWHPLRVRETLPRDGGVAITQARYGIAETGTLILVSSPDSPTLLNYLPLYHIVLLSRACLLDYLDDYWPIVRANGGKLPRNVNWITGTSGTADIEARLVRGAHGPRYLHVLLLP